MKIIIEAYLESISTRVDNSWSLKFSTQEIDGNYVGQLSDLKKAGSCCKLLLSNTNITDIEADMVDKQQIVSGKKHKTESARLRAVLFLLSQQLGVDSEVYYKQIMNGLIEFYKGKLD